jgi:hypothetical protein
VTPIAIVNIDSSANEVNGTQSSVGVREKEAIIQKKPNGLIPSEKVLVMERMVKNKTSPFDFVLFYIHD